MRRAIERVEQVAPTDLSVLITGESGTGKEVFARAIHTLSNRHRQRLVSVNCGAIPETLLEAELFGNEKGAFTGAVEQRKGFFEAADKGTIFLDEIGEMPVLTQVKLLRVLETGEFSRLGSSDVLRTDVRIVAATNRRLEEEVARGNFRRDLFYRLNAVQIVLPPLRDHPEDVPAFVQYFGVRTAEKLGIPFEGVTDDAMRFLMNLPWTGNVRELRNMIETVVTLEKGKQITLDMVRPYVPLMLPESSEYGYSARSGFRADFRNDFRNDFRGDFKSEVGATDAAYTVEPETYQTPVHSLVHLRGKTPDQVERELLYKAILDMASEITMLREDVAQLKEAVLPKPSDASPSNNDEPFGFLPALPSASGERVPSLRLEDVERRLIVAALERSNGNRRQAALELGISERTLYRKLHEYNLLERFP